MRFTYHFGLLSGDASTEQERVDNGVLRVRVLLGVEEKERGDGGDVLGKATEALDHPRLFGPKNSQSKKGKRENKREMGHTSW